MASADVALTWGGFPIFETVRGELAELTAELRALKMAVQTRDIVIQQLQKNLEEAQQDAERGRARESSLQRRAETAEAAEEELASQMAAVEAEAYTRITQASSSGGEEGVRQVKEAERRLGAATERAIWWEQRCVLLEAEMEQGRAREAALLSRAAVAEETKAELQRTAAKPSPLYSVTAQSENSREVTRDGRRAKDGEVAEKDREVADWRLRLKEAERKDGEGMGEAFESVSFGELASMIKLRLWSPSSLKLSS